MHVRANVDVFAGAAQGPYALDSMQEWYRDEFFGAGTMVRHASESDFVDISGAHPSPAPMRLYGG